jgi:hypothetical protein
VSLVRLGLNLPDDKIVGFVDLIQYLHSKTYGTFLMSRSAFIISIVSFCCVTGDALSQAPAFMQSPVLAKARTCMAQLATDGRNAGLETVGNAGDVAILHSSRSEIKPLADSIIKCLGDAFPKKDVLTATDGYRATVWYAKVDDTYIYCVTENSKDVVDNVGVLGGSGPQRKWAGIHYRCGTGSEVGKWGKPPV